MNILANIAGLFVKEGRFDAAFTYFQLAFDQLTPGINERNLPGALITTFITNGDAQYLTELVTDKADAYLARYKYKKNADDLSAGIKTYQLADHLLDKINANHIDLGSKLIWRKNSRRLYEHAIDACYQDNRTADAFYFFEKSRAILLSDQLNEQHSAGKENILVVEQLKKNIISREKELKNIKGQEVIYRQTVDDILDNKQKLFALQQKIKIRNPLHYQHFLDSTFIILQDVQQKILKDHKALIEIYAGDSAV
ncbi:MAG: hypothetical protein WKI04_17830 [Ferruginibacter sp.]